MNYPECVLEVRGVVEPQQGVLVDVLLGNELLSEDHPGAK
jgi:hypothetical protein